MTSKHSSTAPDPDACLMQAFAYKQQYCSSCDGNSTMGMPGTGYMVPSGLGSRWHLMAREIGRGIAEGKIMRLW
eukprot:CAMPEP_0174339988 /NCGR_PEP_ID=MMETSP0810-20121108/24344_1 /TAXON_ID=73025 ORGANISM="Eutreptiella gymnastica-like, Strain CCMP1594" /NCGR_SAMPLE_ID=MMETSP0810 /ASSEMBLY_ACC=CAM_ASM_000659 /LENGTH=73 /DNA_ID=CAMNT_0015460939 /DNA_START=176 /DNA_END=394 /DNA_ORIENTATION=+